MIKGLCFICVALIELLLFDLPSNVGDVVWVTLAITDTRVLWGPRHKRSLVLNNLFLKKGLIWSYTSNLQDLMGAVADSYHSFNNRNSRALPNRLSVYHSTVLLFLVCASELGWGPGFGGGWGILEKKPKFC